MSEFAGLWTYERTPGPTQIWLDPTGAGTPPSPLERFGYWSVKTRAFDGREVDGTEQPVRRLPCRLGQSTVAGFPPVAGEAGGQTQPAPSVVSLKCIA